MGREVKRRVIVRQEKWGKKTSLRKFWGLGDGGNKVVKMKHRPDKKEGSPLPSLHLETIRSETAYSKGWTGTIKTAREGTM